MGTSHSEIARANLAKRHFIGNVKFKAEYVFDLKVQKQNKTVIK